MDDMVGGEDGVVVVVAPKRVERRENERNVVMGFVGGRRGSLNMKCDGGSSQGVLVIEAKD